MLSEKKFNAQQPRQRGGGGEPNSISLQAQAESDWNDLAEKSGKSSGTLRQSSKKKNHGRKTDLTCPGKRPLIAGVNEHGGINVITQWNLVIFNVFGQLAAGLCLYSQWRLKTGNVPPAAWRSAAASAGLALAAGRTAGFGQALLTAAMAACLALLLCSLAAPSARPCGPAACLAGAALVILQACAAVPATLFSASGIFPFLLFPLCTSALGAAFSQTTWLGEPEDRAVRYGRFYLPLRFSLWLMLLLTASAPCIPWSDPLMAKSAFYWMQTQLFWMGVIFTGVTIGLSHIGRITLPLQAVIALIVVSGIYTAFYADGVHAAIDLNTLYMR